MQNYLQQLLGDIADVTENISLPFIEKEVLIHDWISDDDEEKQRPRATYRNGQAFMLKCFHRMKC